MSNESNKENEMTNTADGNDMTETATIRACDADNVVTDEAAVLAKGSDNGKIEASAVPRQCDASDAADMKVEKAGNQTTEALPVPEPSDTTDNESVDEVETAGRSAGASFGDTSDSTDSAGSVEIENESAFGIPVDAEGDAPAHADGARGDATEARETGDETEAGSASSATFNQTGYASSSNSAGAPASSGSYVRVPCDLPQQMPKPQPPAGPSKSTVFLSLLPLFLGALTLFVGSTFPMIFAPISGGIDVRSLIAMPIVILGVLLIVLAVLLGLASLIGRVVEKRRSRPRE